MTNRIVRHPHDATRPLFDFPAFASRSDCADRVVCLSERDFDIILTALLPVEQMQTRVYQNYLDNQLYEIVSSEDFETFQKWVSTIRTNLGGYMACNEYLERIAIALEAMQLNTQHIADNTTQLVTVDEILEDISTVFGITHPLYLIYKWVKDLVPSLELKIPVTDVFKQVSEVITWRLPLLSLVTAISSSLMVLAAAAVGQKIDKLMKDLQDTTANIWALGGRLYDFITESWSFFGDLFKPLLDEFIPDDEGGTGGTDPDTDPSNRIVVNNLVRLTSKVILDCSSCGVGRGCTCGGGGDIPVDGSYIDEEPNIEPNREEEDPPQGNPDWETYDVNKCAHLSKFLDDYIGTLRNWGGLFGLIGGLTAAIIVGITLLTVPPLGIAAILAALSILVTIDLGTLVFFNEIADWVEDEKSRLLCDLMEETEADVMGSYLRSELDGFIDGMDMGGWPAARQRLKDACFNLISNAALNGVIENGGVTPEGYDGSDCEDCGTECELFIVDDINGTETAGVLVDGDLSSPGTVVVGSTSISWSGNPETPAMVIALQGSNCCIMNIEMSSAASGLQFWTEADAAGCGEDVGFAEAFPPSAELCFNRIYVSRSSLANTYFEVELTWTSPCE